MGTPVYRQEVPIFAEKSDPKLQPAFEQLERGESEAAFEAFQKFLEAHPYHPDAYEGAIVALLQQTRWSEAEELTQRARHACPQSPVLIARQTWNWIYLTRESEAYPLVVELLEKGFCHPDWLREVVLPLRNVLLCRLSDLRRTPYPKHVRTQYRKTLQKSIRTLEHWLQQHQFPIPDEPVGTKITLSMIARDEAELLAECLKSVQGVVDEIVLVDTGSTDATPQIAKRFGAKVIHAEWQNDFAAARNLALEHATGDWILVLDADERLKPESRQAILNAVRHPQFAAFHLEIVNEFGEGEYFIHRLVRLFRRLPGIRWEGAIHEQIVPSIARLKGRIATVEAQILHLGYREPLMRRRKKIERNLAIIQQELERNPNDLFHKFNMMHTYFVAGNYEQAIYWAEQVCPYLRGDEDYAGQSWCDWMIALARLGCLEQALQVGADALARGIDDPLVHYTLAQLYYQLGYYQKTLEALEATRESATRIGLLTPDGETLRVGSRFTGDIGIVGHKWWALYARALRGLGRLEEARMCLSRLHQERPDDPVVLIEYGQLLQELGEREQAEQVFLQLAAHRAYELTAHQLLARLWWEVKNYQRALPYIRAVAIALPESPEWQEMWLHAAQEACQWRRVVEAYTFREQHGYPITAQMHINWGRALWQLREYGSALEHFRQAIELDPSDPNAFLNAGDALYQLGAYAEAAEAYAAGIERDPTNAQAWFTLGNCYFRMGVYDAARIAYERALALDPNHERARHNLELTDECIRNTAA